MSDRRCSLVLIGTGICWEPQNSSFYPRNFKKNPPISRNTMKIINIPFSENPIFWEWRLFPGNDIITDQKYWKNHCRFSGNDLFNILKYTPFTLFAKYHNPGDLNNSIQYQIITYFGVNSWENMFNHMLTHVESL